MFYGIQKPQLLYCPHSILLSLVVTGAMKMSMGELFFFFQHSVTNTMLKSVAYLTLEADEGVMFLHA